MSGVRGLDTDAAEHISRTDGRDLQPSVPQVQDRDSANAVRPAGTVMLSAAGCID